MDTEVFDLMICTDCLMLHANGDAGDGVDNDKLCSSIEEVWPSHEGWLIIPEGEDTHFSWNWCDSCMSRLGGDRHTALAVKK
jgi:hypothetical protein